MAKYHCAYLSDGVRRTASVDACSASEAASKMQRLVWAPGCGPIGTPRPAARGQASERLILVSLLLAGALGLASALPSSAQAPQQVALSAALQ